MKVKIVNHLGKIFTPHLSKAIGANRPPPSKNWRLETNPGPPPIRPFLQKEYTNYVEERMKTPEEIKKLKLIKDLRRPYRILCLDGGGVRGALTTVILKRICRHHPNFLNEVDLICGTSAGGLLTLMLACGYTADECDEIFSFGSPHIFALNPWRVINPFRSKYSDKNKQEIMQYYFGERCFGDLVKTCAVVAFRLDGRKSSTHSFFNKKGWRPAVFSNMPQLAGVVEPDLDLKVWDAAMRTSAAPTYFPVFRGYTDGGIVANNPSIVAVSKAMAHYPQLSVKNIALLSIGAGNYPRHTNVFDSLGGDSPLDVDGQVAYGHSALDHADWGIRQWIPFLLDIILDGDSVTTDMVMHYLLAGNKMYHRIDPTLPKQIALDDVTNMKTLQEFGYSLDLRETFKFVDDKFTFDGEFDNEIHNTLDNASNYHEAWLSSLN